jgi:oligoribonuclease
MSEETFVILDAETTGLNPKNGIILELAALHIDIKTLEVKNIFRELVTQEMFYVIPVSELMDAYVTKMHTENGLLAEIEASRKCGPLRDQGALDDALGSWFSKLGGKIVLCGNSIHFDRRFMEECTPHALKLCHYRMRDTSAMRQTYKDWVGEPPQHDTLKHRALNDCYGSLEIMQWFQKIVVAGAYESQPLPKGYTEALTAIEYWESLTQVDPDE